MLQAESAALEEAESADSSKAANDSNKLETGKADASVEGNGDGNGQVPPGQTEDENGNIVNGGGNMAPGLNRGNKLDKPENPNKPSKPENPGTEDKSDKKANKANKGTHIYTYDSLNRMVSSNIAKTITKYTYDTLGNLVLETVKNKSVDYQYNELNQLVKKTNTQNETFTYSYDKRGNRIAETGKKASQQFEYNAANRLVKGINWKSDVSEYTYNGLGLRVNNLVTTHANKTYDRDYVIDYTSPENDDLYVYALGNGQLEYEQRHVYAGSERLEQITEKGNGGWERTLYVHEDVMGNTRYYTKATGQSFAELEYDAWGQPVSPNKLVNNDHGNYVFATFTGHIYDTTLDIYFAEARFYDAANRQWLAMDPVKDGLNWYQYCGSNPVLYVDISGQYYIAVKEIKNSEGENVYKTKIYQENTIVVGAFGGGNAFLPIPAANSVYDVVREVQGARTGTTYEKDQLQQSVVKDLNSFGESQLDAAAEKALAEVMGPVAFEILAAKMAYDAVSGADEAVSKIYNEDILFEMVENSGMDIQEKDNFKNKEAANKYADNLDRRLKQSLEFINSNPGYYNQNILDYGYQTIPSMYEVSKELDKIEKSGASSQWIERKKEALLNRYANNYIAALKNYYISAAGLAEKSKIQESYPGGYAAYIKDCRAQFKQGLSAIPKMQRYMQNYFNELLCEENSLK